MNRVVRSEQSIQEEGAGERRRKSSIPGLDLFSRRANRDTRGDEESGLVSNGETGSSFWNRRGGRVSTPPRSPGFFNLGRHHWQNKYQKTYVDIKSIEIRTVLREILKDVSGIGLREDKPTVEPNLLFNHLPQLENELANAKAVPEEQQNKTLISHLTLFNNYISTDYASTIKRLYPLLKHHEITFDLLWALFLPNTLIYTICAGSGEPRCLKLDWGEQKETLDRGKFFQLDCHYVDYDGKTYGEAGAVLEIDEFRGARRIDSLGVFPLAYHEDEEDVRERLIERGRKFGSLKGMHYKYYKGLAFFKRKRGVVRVNVNGRIMVDPSTFRRINPNYRMSPVKESSTYSSSGTANAEDDSENENEDEDDPDGKIKLVGATPGAAKKKLLETGKTAESIKDALVPEEMTEEQLLLCSPTVLGFSFGDKLWAEFAVEHVNAIKFNPDAFESLVLPEAQKKIVKALVESHTGNRGSRTGIDDVIKGKGKGLVAVLHGRPGVGKTLTAEGISEFLQKPLYIVGVGELGTDSRTLETQLSRILDIAHVWGAVLLLDEADVFLERRSVHDLQRNALVSIFLRLLEYFQGILFLTTNRVETFDEAFQSRIHIALRYNDLDKKARRVIWKTFLGMVAREESGSECELRDVVNDEELEGLARRQLNGRQIKNAVRTAQALALNKNEGLSMEHLKLVLAVTEGFEHDLKGTGNLDTRTHDPPGQPAVPPEPLLLRENG
ncbi:P-loop containing nucleoside triphosphate hydrolase protein [Tuber magnatum]|uniref:P-loop containing nucleoside triphosphate hydrolase protein n=1 Tax=Tuber magnatum TaxID=42249 RepID=A0A317SRE6_9PEZI|nr:P-loop containing nucleoside triphosphate hydrolase protein [Tuber magnatum]